MRAAVAYRCLDGTEDVELFDGSREALTEALHDCIAASDVACVWATDACTGVLIAGLTHQGQPLTTIPASSHGFWVGELEPTMVGNQLDPAGGARSVTPPLARIYDHDSLHVYRAVRGYSTTVLVYAPGGWCIGYASPLDFGFIDAKAMIAHYATQAVK